MICLNIQFWENDKAQAMALVRLICDLEDLPRKDITMLFTCRFDATYDEDTIAYASHKFTILRHKTKRRQTGWPQGPNQMMACSYEYLVENWRRNRLPNIDCVLFVEADCVPLRKGWIDELYAEFKTSGKRVVGAWLKKGDANCEHINGNCVVAMDFWKKCPGMFHPPSKGGWDAALAYAILPNGYPSKLIWSDYQLGMPNNPWRNCDYLFEEKTYTSPENALYGQKLKPAWFHGIKTLDGIRCVRERLLNEEMH